MRLRELDVFTFLSVLVVFGCATQEVKVIEQSPPAGSSILSQQAMGDGAIGYAPDSPLPCHATFRLCARYVKSSQLANYPQANGHWIAIELTEEGRQSFEAFTKAWLRSSACVTLGSELVTTMPVQAVIPSGRLAAVRSTEREAQDLMDKLRAAPETPCGS